jgi:hypothetical protein
VIENIREIYLARASDNEAAWHRDLRAQRRATVAAEAPGPRTSNRRYDPSVCVNPANPIVEAVGNV